ncbi:hypothetical protein B1VFA_014 [Rhizobium phage B1VFA]|nr:hypothetical protein B1VFA_014 [Rhizobium phage B1VFA]
MWINLTDDELKLINLGLSKCQDYLIAGAEELAARIEEQQQVAPNDVLYISAARDHWASDDLEIDDDPRVSAGGDPGAWVHAWVWVRDDEAGIPDEDENTCRECGEEYADGGDGYNGRCPDCADKAEEEGRSDD